MNLKLLIPALFVGMFAVACAEGATAANPAATDQSTTEPSSRGIATSAPATVTRLGSAARAATLIVPTRPSQVRPTISPRPEPTVVRLAPTSTPRPRPTPIRIDPHATATPLWTPTPKAAPTATSTPAPTATPFIPPTVAAAPEDLFIAQLNHQYVVPSGWSQSNTESSLVLWDRSGKINVTISESSVDRWRYPSVVALRGSTLPVLTSDWDSWSLGSEGVIKSGTAYEFQITGLKNGIPYRQYTHWYMWGDVLVEVSAEIPEFDWNNSITVRDNVLAVLNSFSPHDTTHLFTVQDVLGLLSDHFDDRPSGIRARDEVIRTSYEMTCRQLYTDLIQIPEYLSFGLWQVSAQTLTGTETWWVFEPNGSIMTLSSNLSKC